MKSRICLKVVVYGHDLIIVNAELWVQRSRLNNFLYLIYVSKVSVTESKKIK